MNNGNQTSSIVIFTAVIGLITALGTAAIQNWSNLFPQKVNLSTPTPSSAPVSSPTPTLFLTPIASPTPTPSLAPVLSSTQVLPANPSVEEIKSVVLTSLLNDYSAHLSMDIKELQKSYMSDALNDAEARISINSKSGASKIVIDYDFNATKFKNYQVIENNEKVKITVTTTVNLVTYWRDNFTCVKHQPRRVVTEDYYLTKTSTGWLINLVTLVEGVPPVLYSPPCPITHIN